MCIIVSVSVSALTCFTDPLKVSIELSLNLLLSPQLEELASVLNPLSLFGKFTVGTFVSCSAHYSWNKSAKHKLLWI